MSLEQKVDKSKITIVTVWDNEFGYDNFCHLDIYTNKDELIHAANGSFFRDSWIPLSWLVQEGSRTTCRFPERVDGALYLRYSEGLWRFTGKMQPGMVVELYGTANGHLDPSQTSKLIINFLIRQNPRLNPLVDAKPTTGFTKTYHSIWNIELPASRMVSAINAMLKDFIPPEHSNVVVNDYREVGRYTFSEK